MSDSKQERSVGYGAPPVHTRFRPGQSGNPAGRPKGTTSVKKELAAELAKRDGGSSQTKLQALVEHVVAEAMAGPVRDGIALLSLIGKLHPEDDAADPRHADDDAFIEKLLERKHEAIDAESPASDDSEGST
jgi:hypothetical protein